MRVSFVALLAALAAFAATGTALGATPPSATLTPDAQGHGSVSWTGSVSVGTAIAGTTDDCFDADDRPDPASGCDFFNLDVNVPDGFYGGFLGGVQFSVTGFAPFDIDVAVYRRTADGRHAEQVAASGNFPGEDERTTASTAAGPYIVALVPYATPPAQGYQAVAEFALKAATPSLSELNAQLGPLENFRASHDSYISHSEPTIAMDPLDHNHLMAGSKMYENLPDYLFKVGTYESFDGGRTWEDQGHLPGYCQETGQCDPTNEETYRTTSDPSIAFDDEGNAYANVLDAPGGTFAFTGFNMTVHIKRPGQPWTGPITVHDNRNNPVTETNLLDDKNWIAVDNVTDTDGGPNRPGDGKIGTIYVCWSLDASQVPVGQQIVLMRSLDGGQTWGGLQPGDNFPYPLSQKTIVSGIGCHVIVGPDGEVYATWYDNQLDALMQVKSTDRGRSWTLARPIASIFGVNEQFEGQSFRNLSIPTSAVDGQGNVYVAVQSRDAEGEPFPVEATIEDAKRLRDLRPPRTEQEGEGDQPGSGSDIVLFKSTDGGQSYGGPVRVNQDAAGSDADQFQPWIAVTGDGQVNISYFDRRDDPNNFFIATYLSRSNDGGATFRDTRVGRRLWDPRLNPPVSVSGEFIGDYQGLVADDDAAIPFWNDTQLDNLPRSDPEHSPYQEVQAARVPNTVSFGGVRPDAAAETRTACLSRRLRVGSRGIGRVRIGGTQAQTLAGAGTPSRRTARTLRYCVRGGGRVLVGFSRTDHALLVATTAHRVRGIRRGSSLRRVRRAYPHARSVARGVLLTSRSSRLVVGVRRSRVTYVAVVDRRLAGSPRLLRSYLRLVKLR